MRARRPLVALHTALFVVVLLAPGGSAHARPIRTLRVGRDVPRADVVVVAKIVSSVFQKNAQWMERRGKTVMPVPANAGFAVDEYEVTAKVLLSVKGRRKKGALVTFRHRLENPTGQPMVNGFMSHAFALAANYLLVLVKEPDKVLAVTAPEQWFYPTFPDALVPKLPTSQHAASALVHVYRLLLARFEYGKAPDKVGVSSAAFLTDNQAGRTYLQRGAQHKRLLTRLQPLADAWLGTEAHLGVLCMLRDLGAPVSTKRTLVWILNAALPGHVRVNLLHNLYTAPAAEQLAALDKVIGSGTDPEVVKAATSARPHAVDRVAREEAASRRKKEREERRRLEREAGGK